MESLNIKPLVSTVGWHGNSLRVRAIVCILEVAICLCVSTIVGQSLVMYSLNMTDPFCIEFA